MKNFLLICGGIAILAVLMAPSFASKYNQYKYENYTPISEARGLQEYTRFYYPKATSFSCNLARLPTGVKVDCDVYESFEADNGKIVPIHVATLRCPYKSDMSGVPCREITRPSRY